MVADSNLHWTAGAHLKPDLIALELYVPDFDRRIRSEQELAVPVDLQSLLGLRDIVK